MRLAGSPVSDGGRGLKLEFGTAKMAAQPFLRPAYDAARSKAIAAMQAAMAEQLKKALPT